MISVGSRDGRKDLGLGFGGRGGAMEDSELEEGEACYCSDVHDEDACSDPDIDFSYIDERLQDILGHLQKDFEGGVSAENLGAKFGGYGSFLPSCPRSPPALSHPKTPQKVQSSSIPRSPNILQSENPTLPPGVRVGQIPLNAVQLPVSKVSPVDFFSKRDLSLSVPKHESVSKLIYPLDQKTLKVRIKVGPDSKLAPKTVALYTGLGLDGSPSSSVEDSPTQSMGFALRSEEILGQSPMSILQDMTSFPIPGGCLLSPLSESFSRLMEREMFQMDCRAVFAQKCSEDSSAMSSYESPARTSDKGFGEQKQKLATIGSVEVNNSDPGSVVLPKKGMGVEIPDETCESTICHIGTGIEKYNLKISSTGMVRDNKKTGLQGDVRFDPGKNGKDLVGRSNGFKKKKVSKATNPEPHDLITPHQTVLPPSGRKKNSKGSQCNVSPKTVFSKENLKSGSPALGKVKKKRIGDHPSRGKPVGKLCEESEKNRESHVDLFKDNEEAEIRLDFSEKQFRDGLNENKLGIADGREKSSGEKFDKKSTTEANPKAVPDFSLPRRGPISDAIPATTNTVLINDDWVCCDRCGKWRLLPYGTNAEVLQQSQWLCSMLTWLPGKNRCEISEEETTKALEELYYGNQNNLHSHAEGPASGIPLGDTRHPGQNHWDHSLPAIAGERKKKHKVKEASSAVSQMGLMHSLNPTKKNQQASLKSRDNVKQSPSRVDLANKANFQNLSKSTDIAVAEERDMQKGDTKHLKMNGKREANTDEFRALKKIKKERLEGLDYADEDQTSHRGEIAGKVIISNNGFRDKMDSKDAHKHKYSSKESKCDVNDRSSAYPKKKKDQLQASFNGGALDLGNSDKMKISAKKRKVKDWQESDMYPPPVSLPNRSHNLQDNWNLVKNDSIESEFNKGEETRLFKSEGKESGARKGESNPSKKHRGAQGVISNSGDLEGMEGNDKGSVAKGRQVGSHKGPKRSSRQTLEGTELLRRDLGYGQVSVSTTASSSKISGSHKSKANFQDVKSSPVESVSSSPMRLSNHNKIMPARRNLMGKDDVADVGLPIMSSPKRCFDGEEDCTGDQFGTIRKEKTSSVHSFMVDNRQKYANHSSRGKVEGLTGRSSVPESVHVLIACKEQHNQHRDKVEDKEHDHSERVDKSCNHSNGSLPQKSGKGSLRCRDKRGSSKSSCGGANVKISNLSSEREDLYSTEKTRFEAELGIHGHPKSGDGKYNYQEKFGVKSTKEGRDCLHKRSAEKCSNESRKENRSKSGRPDGSDAKGFGSCIKNRNINLQQNQHDLEGFFNFSVSDRTDGLETEQKRVKSKFLPYSGDKQETPLLCPQSIDEAQGGSVSNVSPVSGNGGRLEAPMVPKLKPDNQNGAQNSNLRHLAVKTVDASSPVRKDSSSQVATSALKEAKDLKHKADRLKNAGAELESTGLYFRAALKFLYGASLLEPCNSESAKHGEMTHSMHVYSDTARLCEFVAHEYERCKEMAAAALAYKCMEVAYMKVIYSKHSCLSRDRHELQAALQMVPPGESPSSSASDIDNLNNQGSLDKAAVAKGVNSPQVTGNHVIVARNRPSFLRLLNFAQDTIFAMEASRKSHSALAASNLGRGEAQDTECISSVRKAIDFNFHDVEGLLCLVRLAMEAISH